MSETLQLILVILAVGGAAFYVVRHLRRQVRRPDADFSGPEHDCGTCPIAPENLPPRPRTAPRARKG